MANPRALDKRRKSVRNVRKITRPMELIATARYKKAMDRATAATAYTDQIMKIVARLKAAGLSVDHPLLQQREEVKNAAVLVLTSNRGLCGGYNGAVIRQALPLIQELRDQTQNLQVDICGKRGLSGLGSRGVSPDNSYTQFEDQPGFTEVSEIANGYLEAYIRGEIDRLDVIYTRFISTAKQVATV
ncbi:MAG: F0F1 ATP synthase subunit gamma, partial [Planctomycetota bacterium]